MDGAQIFFKSDASKTYYIAVNGTKMKQKYIGGYGCWVNIFIAPIKFGIKKLHPDHIVPLNMGEGEVNYYLVKRSSNKPFKVISMTAL